GEYAFSSRGVVARVAVRERQLVGAGAPVDAAPVDAGEPGGAEAPPSGIADPRWAAIAGRLAVGLTATAWLVHIGCVVTRGLAARRVPWGNMYEFVLAVGLVGATAWLVILVRRPTIRPLGLFVTLVLVVLLGVAGMRLYTSVAPLQPVLNSYWLKIHV